MNTLQHHGLRALRAAAVALMGLLLTVAGSAAAAPGGLGGTGIDPGGIGGTGISPGGIGGTGIVAIGPIQRFGSIFVNGGEYEITPQTRYRVDGNTASAQNLHLGDMVSVHAVAADGRLDALDVRVDHAVIGRVSQIDPFAGRLVVLGQIIQIQPTTLLRTANDQPLPLSSLSVGDVVRISALYQGSRHWQALRLVKLSSPAAISDAAPFLLRGRVEALDAAAQQIRINGVWMSLERNVLPTGLAVGAQVVARGSQGQHGMVIHSLQPSPLLDAPLGSRVVLVGYLQRTPQGWESHGLRIDAASAALNGALQSAADQPQAPLVLVGTLRPAQTVEVERVIPNVDAMQFALPPLTGAATSSPAKTGAAAGVGGTAAQPMPSGQNVNTPMSGVASPVLPTIILPNSNVPTIPAIPAVPLQPTVNIPAVTPPAVNVPSVTPPAVNVPSVTPPAVNVPSVTPPAVNTPNVPTPSLPSKPQIPSFPRP